MFSKPPKLRLEFLRLKNLRILPEKDILFVATEVACFINMAIFANVHSKSRFVSP